MFSRLFSRLHYCIALLFIAQSRQEDYAASFFNVLHAEQATQEIRTVQVLPGGNYVIFGRIMAGTSSDVFVALLDPLGIVLSDGLYAAQENQAPGTLDALPAHGGFYISSSTQNDWLLAKLSTIESIVWSKRIGGRDVETISQVKTTPDQGCIIIGSVAKAGAKHDMLVAKMSPDGRVQWSRRLGGEGADHGRQIVVMSDGSYILLCDTTSFRQPANHSDMCLVKLGPNGDMVWGHFIDSPGTERALTLHAASPTAVLISGTTDHDARSDLDGWVIKFDVQREKVLWSKDFSSFHAGQEALPVLATASNGDLFLGGSVANHMLFARATPSGNVTWARRCEAECGHAYSMTGELERFVAAGTINGYKDHQGEDALVMKIDTEQFDNNCHGFLQLDTVEARERLVTVRPAMFARREYVLDVGSAALVRKPTSSISGDGCSTAVMKPTEQYLSTPGPNMMRDQELPFPSLESEVLPGLSLLGSMMLAGCCVVSLLVVLCYFWSQRNNRPQTTIAPPSQPQQPAPSHITHVPVLSPAPAAQPAPVAASVPPAYSPEFVPEDDDEEEPEFSPTPSAPEVP